MTVQSFVNFTKLVHEAIARSSEMKHVQGAFATRNPGPDSEGSVFLDVQTPHSFMQVEWRPASDPAINAPAQGFVADIPGFVGVVELSALDPETPCEMVLGHKGTLPFVNPVIQRSDVPGDMQKVGFTTMLLGPADEHSDDLIVWTFYPGASIPQCDVPPSEATQMVKTVGDVIALGLFTHAKVAGK